MRGYNMWHTEAFHCQLAYKEEKKTGLQTPSILHDYM